MDAGNDLTYTINWSITGNEPADKAMIVDKLPAGVVFKSASNSGMYDAATNTVTWNLGNKVPGDSGSYTVVVNVPSPQYNGTKLTNVVDFTDETPNSKPAKASVISTVRADHELGISKTATPIRLPRAPS